jgi:hypothetical protein
MARLALTPTVLAKNAPTDITTLLAAGTLGANTGVSFSNSGREFLVVSVAAGGSTCSVNIGTTTEGQQPPALTPALTASKVEIFPPFPFDEDQPATGLMWVDFGTPANVTVALIQFAG